MMDYVSLAFVGLWPMVIKYSVWILLFVGALAFAYFSPVFKKTALWVALGIGIGTACYAVGVSDGEKHVRAEWLKSIEVTNGKSDKARVGAERDVKRSGADGVRHDRFNRDRN